MKKQKRMTREQRAYSILIHMHEESRQYIEIFPNKTPYFSTRQLCEFAGYSTNHWYAVALVEDLYLDGDIQRKSLPMKGVAGKKHMYYLRRFSNQLEMEIGL